MTARRPERHDGADHRREPRRTRVSEGHQWLGSTLPRDGSRSPAWSSAPCWSPPAAAAPPRRMTVSRRRRDPRGDTDRRPDPEPDAGRRLGDLPQDADAPTFSAKAKIERDDDDRPARRRRSAATAPFDGGDSTQELKIVAGHLHAGHVADQVGTQPWSKKAPGPWLEDPKRAPGSTGTSIGDLLQGLVKVDRPGRRDQVGPVAPPPAVRGRPDTSRARCSASTPASTKDATFTARLLRDR